MVSSRILKRRKRAQVGTLLAVLLILLPLPAGAYLYGEMTDLQDQSVVFTMDGTPDDPIFDQSLVEYDNVSDTYTYTKTDSSDNVIENTTSDLKQIAFGYVNSSGTTFQSVLSYTESSDKIFSLLEKSQGDPDDVLTIGGVSSYCAPDLGYLTVVSPSDMLDQNVDNVRVYWENDQSMNLTAVVGVYDPDEDSGSLDNYIPIKPVDSTGVLSSDRGLFEIACSGNIFTSVNGSFTDIEISETSLLTAATSHPDGYIFVTFVDSDGGTLEETNGILVGMEMIGSDDSPVTMSGIWQAALVATGLFGMVGAVIATPYMSVEGLTGDGMKGQRYKKGYNPRKKYNKRRK
jgi:hypothetical protein